MALPKTFRAMVVTETADKKFIRDIQQRDLSDLPSGELIIEVKYSSLNYKDALSASGNKGVTRKYPHTPGVDAAGVVVDSTNRAFAVGDQVIVTGFDLGMNTPGGFGQYITIPSGRAVKGTLGNCSGGIVRTLARVESGAKNATLTEPLTMKFC